ncbi:MAG: Ig domain-containing protein, partial [Nitrosopumilaceae archaeon]
MLRNLTVFSVFSLVILMIFPAYAAVESINFEKSFYTDEENFTFVGIADGGSSVFVIIHGPGGGFAGMASDPVIDGDGSFATIPRPVDNFFKSSGTYNATAFTDDQKEEEGISFLLEYDGTKVTEQEDFVLTLRSIPDKTVTEGKTLSFTVSVTDSSLDNLIFSLDKNPPSGASIGSDTGKFTWTPTTAQGNANGVQYSFDIVVEKGSQKDSESIIITVKDPVVEQPKDEPKEQPKDEPKEQPKDEPKELGIASFVDESKDPQSYVDRYNSEPKYKAWFDENFPEYDSIYEAVGLEKPLEIPAPFVDPNEDPQYYVDRYNSEPKYKAWFDEN